MSHSRFRCITLATAIASCLVANSLAQGSTPLPGGPTRKTSPTDDSTEIVVLPKSVPDPIEPLNRVVYAINSGIITGVVKPTADAYRLIVIKPVRTGIGNFGVNIVFPGRLINNCLQGKWNGARDETYRFCCNTTVGLAGFIDPATKWNIPKSDADFGQTFGQWGWRPGCYIMLPIFGPSNERDTLGLAADTAANPLTYIAPYTLTTANPLTYFGPYTYASFAIMYNNLTDTVNEYTRFNKSQMDAYSELQYAWTFVRKNRVADFQVKGQPDPSSLETLGSVFFTFRNPEFPGQGKTRSVLIPATGRKLQFTFWLQPGKAPLVYIVPGLGSHRLAETSLALAELVYERGFSAVCVSSTFNFEFMEQASTAEVPGYTPVDVHDLHISLTEMTRRLEDLYPERFGPKVLMGYSMGAFQALFLAAADSTNAAPLLAFDRYVAINSPVGLLHGISMLDEYFDAPLAWPAAERADNIENTFLKVAVLSKSSLTPRTSLPFSGIESKFLIGMAFRLTLRDAIFSSQQRHNLGVLEHPIRKLRRTASYQEILQYSYRDYNQKFLVPYYWSRGIELSDPNNMENANSLRTYAASLHANKKIRLIVNRNDFLLPAEDLAWVKSTFAKDQIAVFEEGGHLGNLSDPKVQKAILEALQGLRAP